MRVQQLLEHHGIAVNPFAEEDAQSDPVFKERCRDLTYHPAWDKVYGNPSDPATSIVFGEKGAGKTAMRMQMAGRMRKEHQLPTGTAIKDSIRKVAQGGGKTVANAVDGLKAIAAGEKVDYTGASGPCDFDDKGDIIDCKFRYDQIKAGKFTLVKIA